MSETKLKRYRVTEKYLVQDVYIVEAESKDDAEEAIYDGGNPAESEFLKTVSTTIEEVEA